MTENERLAEVQISSEDIFDGHILHVKKDGVKLPNGNTSTREIIRHVGAVCVIPITDDMEAIVERQFRYPINMVITEVPAGKLDSFSEDRLKAAMRELREETGYQADEWIDMGIYYPAAAYSDEKITMYMAKGLHKGEQDLDADEFLDVLKVPLKDLVDDVVNGIITDGKSQVCILKAARILGL